MKRSFWVFGFVVLVGVSVMAVDVPLRDGTVIEAESYKVTGSYVMIKMANGAQVAYDVVDVDLETLRAAEEAAAAAAGGDPETPPETPRDTLSGGRSLKTAEAATDDTKGQLKISDQDVKHVRGSGVRGEDEQRQEDEANDDGIPEGYREGGRVKLVNVQLNPIGDGQWRINGEVVNGNPTPVLDVAVKLETIPPEGGEPWSGEVSVASQLNPDQGASFSHSFSAEVPEGRPAPSVRASVIWMQSESRREPDYTKAGGVPHPSNLPLNWGGVSGAAVVPTPVQ